MVNDAEVIYHNKIYSYFEHDKEDKSNYFDDTGNDDVDESISDSLHNNDMTQDGFDKFVTSIFNPDINSEDRNKYSILDDDIV